MTDASAQPGQHFDSDAAMAAGTRLGNGLVAESYRPLCDLLAEDADLVLTALGRARIAAYLVTANISVVRLYVDEQERGDARAIVTATGARSAADNAGFDNAGFDDAGFDDERFGDGFAGGFDTDFDDAGFGAVGRSEDVASDGEGGQSPDESRIDANDLDDLDATFKQLTAGWNVDISAAARAAAAQQIEDDEAEASRPREFEIAESTPDPVEHYVAPTPPPLPRISAATVRALAVIALGVAALVFGGLLDFDPNLTLLLGVGGILIGAGMLVMRLRPHGDDSDDGAVL